MKISKIDAIRCQLSDVKSNSKERGGNWDRRKKKEEKRGEGKGKLL